MIVLDTNVVSEAMKQTPDAAVLDWLNRQSAETLYLTSITVAELMFGIAVLPAGRRKKALGQTLDGLTKLFRNRILPFDFDAAARYAELASAARARGKGLPQSDGYIAAIAVAQGFIVATRDTAPFEAAGVRVINPWKAD